MAERMIFISIVLLLFAGCASEEAPKYTEEELAQIPQPIREGLPEPSGGFNLAVGDDTISSKDIAQALISRLGPMAQQMGFEEFANRAMPMVAVYMRDRIGDMLLYRKAKTMAPEEIDEQLNKAVEAETRKFIMKFGGDYAKAEAFLQSYYGMDWKEYRKYQKRMILSSSYLQGSLDEETPVTYSEMRRYYDQERENTFSQEETVTIRLIDIEVARVSDDANTTKLKVATDMAIEVLNSLDAGGDFAALAKQYSDGYRGREGGLWKPVKPESLAKPYDVLGQKAVEMNIGEVSEPIERDGHIFIMKLEDKKVGSVIAFEDVQTQIEQKLLMERKRASFQKVMDKVMADAAISGLEEFLMFCLKDIYQAARVQ